MWFRAGHTLSVHKALSSDTSTTKEDEAMFVYISYTCSGEIQAEFLSNDSAGNKSEIVGNQNFQISNG